jgi:Outer membrane protein beta-barrel domain
MGAGVSIAFAENWNVFAEYRYTNFETMAFTLPLSQLSTTSTTKLSAIELGVNYKFGPTTSFAPPSGPPTGGQTGSPTTPLYKSLPGRGPYNWTGLYFGADGGYAWQRSSGTLTTASGALLTPYGYNAIGPFAGSSLE